MGKIIKFKKPIKYPEKGYFDKFDEKTKKRIEGFIKSMERFKKWN